MKMEHIHNNSINKISKRRKSDPNKQERKFFRRCNECVNCKRVECGQCKHCLDMPKFGGSYKLKKACVDRECVRSKQDHANGGSIRGGGANRNPKGGVTRVQQTHQGVTSHVTRVQPVQPQERSAAVTSATAQNKGKYYIIPNGSGEIYQLQSFTPGHHQIQQTTRIPGVSSSQTILKTLPTSLATNNTIDMKPKPSSIGISYAGAGKPGQKVYTCTLASNQPASATSLLPSTVHSVGQRTILPTNRQAISPAIITSKPTVNLKAAKRRREDSNASSGGYSAPTTPTDVVEQAANLDIDDFVNKYLKVYYEDQTSTSPLGGSSSYLDENLEEFGLEVIADIKFHPSGGGCESFWGEGSWDSSSSDSGDTRWKDYDDTDLELGTCKLLEYEEEPFTGAGSEAFKLSSYRGCQFCTLNSKCINCHNYSPPQREIN